uniref:Cytochrome c-553 n=1 Tax=Pseudopediastrum boryanum TaxID=55410 RepID=A9ZPL6_PSEBY|nr:cytochrome c6 precursor [Pseudopediastrum boryanum]
MQTSMSFRAASTKAGVAPTRASRRMPVTLHATQSPIENSVVEKVDRVAGLARVISTAATGVLVAACLTLSAQTTPAHADADLALGQQVFEGNCAACHAGGNNNVIPDHTLRKAAIEQFLDGGFKLEAIKYQVENGKGAMPAWDGRLSEDEIDSVSAYVYDKAANDSW